MYLDRYCPLGKQDLLLPRDELWRAVHHIAGAFDHLLSLFHTLYISLCKNSNSRGNAFATITTGRALR